jgi:dTDP-4-amino-4,6-dideoxygalactose transaminase
MVYDIRLGDFRVTETQRAMLNDILDSGKLTEGPYVKKLEQAMSKYLGVKHAICVTNGTAGLELVSLIIPDDKLVCVPALTFPATMNAFVLTAKSVTMCDVGDDLQIDIDNLDESFKKTIGVMVPVHLMGYTANMEKIMKEAKKYGWFVVEDTCEAFGAFLKKKKAGTFGDVGVYSFFMSHNIGCGELGLVVTNDDKLAEKMRSVKNHGRTGSNLEFNHSYVGGNYKTTEFMAALCYSQLVDADMIIKTRLDAARYMKNNIKNKNLTPFDTPDGFSPLGYPIKCVSKDYRDSICKKLNLKGIETRKMFPCLANQPAYAPDFTTETFKKANELESVCFYLPCHQFLTENDLNRIIKILNEE